MKTDNSSFWKQICGLFIGAAKSLPIYHGEITVIALGMDLQAWNDDGQPVIDETGDMVICKPFPSTSSQTLPHSSPPSLTN